MAISSRNQYWLDVAVLVAQQTYRLELLEGVVALVAAAAAAVKMQQAKAVAVVVMAQCLSGLGNERLGR
jgi:hypothetical protein